MARVSDRARGGRRWLLLCVLAGAVLLAAGGWRRWTSWHAQRRAGEALDNLGVCLLGAPLSEIHAAERRLRRVQIAASLDPAQASWPTRCAPSLAAAQRAVTGLQLEQRRPCGGRCCTGDALCSGLGGLREQLASTGAWLDGEDSAFDVELLTVAVQALRIGGSGGASSGTPPAPQPSTLLDAARMTPLFEGNYLRLLSDPAGDASAELLFYEQAARYGHCAVDLGAGGRARCRELPHNIPVGQAGELLAAEGGAPQRMYAQGPDGFRWTHALYDVDSGDELTEVGGRPAGGFVWRDGSSAHLHFETPLADMAVYRRRGGDVDAPVTLTLEQRTSFGPRVVWDHALWAVPLGDGRHRLEARRLQPDGDPFGPRVRLGTTAAIGSRVELELCRTSEALALLVHGGRSRAAAEASLYFHHDDRWHAPVALRLGSGRYGFTCSGRRATFSWVAGVDERPIGPPSGSDGSTTGAPIRGNYRVHKLRCTAAGCQARDAALELERFSSASRYVAGDLGNATIVLWRSPLGDVRARIAPIERLAAARDIPLFDDVEHDGFDWDLERDPIFGRAGRVLVLLSRQIGTSEASATYGVTIDASGQVTPLAVEHAAHDPDAAG
jgi:hypothetical protein